MEQIQVASSPAGRTKKLQDRLDRFPFDGLRVCARRCLLGVIRVESRSRTTLGTVYTRVSVPASLSPVSRWPGGDQHAPFHSCPACPGAEKEERKGPGEPRTRQIRGSRAPFVAQCTMLVLGLAWLCTRWADKLQTSATVFSGLLRSSGDGYRCQLRSNDYI